MDCPWIVGQYTLQKSIPTIHLWTSVYMWTSMDSPWIVGQYTLWKSIPSIHRGLRYLPCVSVYLYVRMYVYVCASATTLVSTSFVSMFQVRYVRLLFLIFNRGFSMKPSVQSICLPQPPRVLMQRPFTRIYDDRAFKSVL